VCVWRCLPHISCAPNASSDASCVLLRVILLVVGDTTVLRRGCRCVCRGVGVCVCMEVFASYFVCAERLFRCQLCPAPCYFALACQSVVYKSGPCVCVWSIVASVIHILCAALLLINLSCYTRTSNRTSNSTRTALVFVLLHVLELVVLVFLGLICTADALQLEYR